MPVPSVVPLLCSASPRRAALLIEAGVPFEKGPAPDIDETPPAGIAPERVAEALAIAKAVVAVQRAPGRVVATADTTVLLRGAILGKPADGADARRMLTALSGEEHVVVTGVAVARDGRVEHGAASARVRFRVLLPREIDEYVASGEPFDKAGGYAIQGGARNFVERVEGSMDTVVGLPVGLLRRLLALFD